METTFDVLPTRTGGAAENMAIDFLLLQRYARPSVPRFRHYEWRAPAFTFGYSQKISFVREQIAGLAGGSPTAADLPMHATPFDLCRRRTGGGLVDHRDDWTYALVIPRGHPLEEGRAVQSYRIVHEALAEALRAQGVPAGVKAAVVAPDEAEDGPGGICFTRAELFDVIHEPTGGKIAGAAQKRNKQGLLLQGSIWRPTAGGDAIDWDHFQEDFGARLAMALDARAEPAPWPELDDEVDALTEQFSSPEWNEGRSPAAPS